MKEILLTQGKLALIDDEDFMALSQYKWFAHRTRQSAVWYAERRHVLDTGKPIILGMHRQILGLQFRDGIKADHRDGNGLNNQRYNLRKCSDAQNACNRRIPSIKNKASKFKGVSSYDRGLKPWRAYVCCDGKAKTVGYFRTEEAAALAYNLFAKRLYGEFARLNIIK